MTLYNLKSALDDYRITKFTPDLDVESSYLIGTGINGQIECECPAGTRPTCRHRQMLNDLIPLVDTEFFWDFERSIAVDTNGRVLSPLDYIGPHSPTVTPEDFDSSDGGSIPPAAAAAPAASWRRI
jgi:hypothetical protein